MGEVKLNKNDKENILLLIEIFWQMKPMTMQAFSKKYGGLITSFDDIEELKNKIRESYLN